MLAFVAVSMLLELMNGDMRKALMLGDNGGHNIPNGRSLEFRGIVVGVL